AAVGVVAGLSEKKLNVMLSQGPPSGVVTDWPGKKALGPPPPSVFWAITSARAASGAMPVNRASAAKQVATPRRATGNCLRSISVELRVPRSYPRCAGHDAVNVGGGMLGSWIPERACRGLLRARWRSLSERAACRGNPLAGRSGRRGGRASCPGLRKSLPPPRATQANSGRKVTTDGAAAACFARLTRSPCASREHPPEPPPPHPDLRGP